MSDPQTFDDLIASALERAGLGLTDFCAARGLNPRTIYRWRRGRFKEPQMGMVAAVAKALGVGYEVLSAALDETRKAQATATASAARS